MTKPYVFERRIGDNAWYLASARFPSAYMAKQAWERMERKLPRSSIGIYRHGPSTDPGILVSVVSLDSDQVARAAQFLTLGEHEPLDPRVQDALIVRRADVVVHAASEGMQSGRLKWRRPGTGASLNPDGTMTEPGGQG
jgi:hypothetical protein